MRRKVKRNLPQGGGNASPYTVVGKPKSHRYWAEYEKKYAKPVQFIPGVTRKP